MFLAIVLASFAQLARGGGGGGVQAAAPVNQPASSAAPGSAAAPGVGPDGAAGPAVGAPATGGDGSPSADTAAANDAAAECNVCSSTKCMRELEVCEAEPDCWNILACWGEECGFRACKPKCVAQSRRVAKFEVLDGCIMGECGCGHAPAAGSALDLGMTDAELRSQHPDAGVIRQTVRGATGRLRMCYETALTRDASMHGKAIVTFDVDTSGAVRHVRFDKGTTLTGPCLLQCLCDVLLQLLFAPSPRALAVRYPVVFAE